jgi:hypothetical protein
MRFTLKRLMDRPRREVRHERLALAEDWRTVLAQDVSNARPILSSLLKTRVTITPKGPKRWELRGEGTLAGLFSRASPMPASWNQIAGWLKQVDGLRHVA